MLSDKLSLTTTTRFCMVIVDVQKAVELVVEPRPVWSCLKSESAAGLSWVFFFMRKSDKLTCAETHFDFDSAIKSLLLSHKYEA